MRPHEFAKKLGVNVQTLRRWDKSGKLKAKRTISNHRYYTEDDLLQAKGLKPVQSYRHIKVYCRVSSSKQKKELANQKTAMEEFCLAKGLEVDEWIEEIGGALTRMSDAGVPLRHIQAISGHKTLSALERYLGVTEQQKETAISTLDF